MAQLEADIARLTRELDDNLSLGTLQKLNLKKQLAGLKAEYSRKQQGR